MHSASRQAFYGKMICYILGLLSFVIHLEILTRTFFLTQLNHITKLIACLQLLMFTMCMSVRRRRKQRNWPGSDWRALDIKL